jgi:hypothetical protein
MTAKELHDKIRFIQLNNQGSQAQVAKAIEGVIDAEIGVFIDALMQITKRDDWTGGECRHYARSVLEKRSKP